MDELTIQLARSGSKPAQAELLRRLQDVWFRMSLSLLHDSDRARDATQETALRFLMQLPTFRGQSQLRTWSLGIAINVCREMRRRERPIDPVRLAGARPDRPAGPLGDAEAADTTARLRALVAELPERQREAVLLRFFEDLSVDQAADVMNCAPGTIKATVHQALRALKKRLGATTMGAIDE